MGQVVANASMSLDGYIAKQDNTIGRLFDWLQNGDVEVPTVDDRITLHMGPASAEYWHRWVDGLGALVCGRTLFDVTGGWSGMHTIGCARGRGDPPGPDRLGRGPPGRSVPLRHERRGGCGGEGAGDRGGAHRGCDGRHHCGAMPRARPARRGRHRPGARGDGGWPSVLRGDEDRTTVPLGDPTECLQGDRVTHLRFPVTGSSAQPSEGQG